MEHLEMNEQEAYNEAEEIFGDDKERIIAFIEGWRYAKFREAKKNLEDEWSARKAARQARSLVRLAKRA